jgi:hypothetical protein
VVKRHDPEPHHPPYPHGKSPHRLPGTSVSIIDSIPIPPQFPLFLALVRVGSLGQSRLMVAGAVTAKELHYLGYRPFNDPLIVFLFSALSLCPQYISHLSHLAPVPSTPAITSRGQSLRSASVSTMSCVRSAGLYSSEDLT